MPIQEAAAAGGTADGANGTNDAGGNGGAMEAARARAFPMPIREQDAAAWRWQRKPVLRSLALDRMHDESVWEAVEQAQMSFTAERGRPGCRSVRLESPTTSDKSYQTEAPGRPHGKAAVKRLFPGEDWRAYNRLRFWVYPTLPGFRHISLSVVLHNEGAIAVPDDYLREGIHYFQLQPDTWNEVVWEIAHLDRDRVTGVEFVYRLQGSDDGAARRVRYDISGLELQEVDADYSEGWAVAPGSIAFSHSGYAPDAVKTAVACGTGAARFAVLAADGGAVAYEGDVRRADSPLGEGGYELLDFTALAAPGRYVVRLGELTSGAFEIGPRVWEASIWKTLNFFYGLRCGMEVPGVHDVCHRDFLCRHGDRQIVINGGWHDAGDLSQGLVNTAEAVYAMLSLAAALAGSGAGIAAEADAALVERLREEARWGLQWMLKTRFGDGYRTTWATMDLWTDGILGTADDEVCEAGDDPLSNFAAAQAEALAARSYRDADPILAARALTAAREDWAFARAAFDREADEMSEWQPPLIAAAAGVGAAVELYEATGEQAYLERAAELAAYVLACQQTTLPDDWDTPLNGFFYTSPARRALLHFPHRGHEQAPVVALGALLRVCPDHADAGRWYAAIVLHSAYMKRLAAYTAPYDMLPAGIYDLAASDDPAYREQVLQGVRLSDRYYVRRFPVWYAMRGNTGTGLSQAKAVSAAAALRRDDTLRELAVRQLEWTVGRNPFAQSLMYGEGYDFTPQYTAMSGDLCGSLPVGIQTKREADVPYWPMQNCYNYKEVWVHPSSRWLWLMCDLYGPAGEAAAGEKGADDDVTVSCEADGSGLRWHIRGLGGFAGGADCRMVSHNLRLERPHEAEQAFAARGEALLSGEIIDAREPAVLLVVPGGRLDRSREWTGGALPARLD
ncbi:glycoside hydrolase family 9 protein [Cohnella sp. 56]|uniref:glycoside hydrolase family 9 protein n=1 Tax=Cohnella sp. 56 TaxID=3113722 RepID=UPI0030E785F6